MSTEYQSFQVKQSKFNKGVFLLIILAIGVFSFSAGNIIGRQQAVRAEVPEGEGQVINRDSVSAIESEDIDFAQFWDVWNLVKETYFKQPVSEQDLFYGALKGMVAGAGDQYTVYFDPKEAQAFTESLEGKFEGIGAEIGLREDKLVIVAPLPNTPASNAGVQPNDHIVLIDGEETRGMTVEEAVTRIRGEKGTTVVLTILRGENQELMDISITRDTIVIDSVQWEINDEGVATISIFTFNHDTVGLFEEAINEVMVQGAKGIILDLRSNPGGLLNSAIHIASAWVGSDTVVIEKTKDDMREFKGFTAGRLKGVNTVVLINEGSASGSEIVAGALQDYDLATLVGMQTFGKGSVQDYQELSDGSAVKITIAEWFTPDGRSINEEGVAPDIEVEFSIEDFNAERDPQKEKAIEVLLAK